MTVHFRSLALSIGLAALCGSSQAAAQTIGAAQSFAVVGGTAVTAAGAGTTITGDVGVSPGTSITGFPGSATIAPPFETHANDSSAVAAQAAATSLYATLAGASGAVLLPAELGERQSPQALIPSPARRISLRQRTSRSTEMVRIFFRSGVRSPLTPSLASF